MSTQEHTAKPSRVISNIENAFANDKNIVKTFIEEKLITGISEENEIKMIHLYGYFKSYWFTNKISLLPIKRKRFVEIMKSLGYVYVKNSKQRMCFKGLKVQAITDIDDRLDKLRFFNTKEIQNAKPRND